ncbi:5-formyltetrahydrofolate cyclo-ligase [Arthrobacter sp. GCM10027362]|uniref:5-formyltetrahydrofolate cyclo-ligase n=1 Tax=Arthrobacter sp. GCM10027362 TaxID=3273379 RepID=UPI0036431A74
MTAIDKTDKEAVRTRFRQQRAALDAQARRAAAAGLADVVLSALPSLGIEPGSTVAAYLSVGSEPSTALLLPGMVRAGYEVIVPVCEPHYQLSWARWYEGVPLARSPRAWVDEPVGERFDRSIMAGVPLILAPGLAIDHAGNRLGQGGGYYDRFLGALARQEKRPRTVGVVYRHELVPVGTFESTPLDIPLDGAVTDEAWTWFDAGNSSRTAQTV